MHNISAIYGVQWEKAIMISIKLENKKMHDLTPGGVVGRIGWYLVSVTPEDLQCSVFKQNHFR